MKFNFLCLGLAVYSLGLTSCKQFLYGSNDVNFLGVPNKPRSTTPSYSSGSSYGGATYSSGAPAYTPNYSAGPAPYSSVESQDQKMRNYGQQLDRQISRQTW
ncbi:hypothetical protein EI77_02488 [Prosthecobacter fusiformis]|uniref:Uncharacterized protein n=1 Tax=Prosthecobacter fusiformis TaxID=48464 RepID=A0A4R7RZG2_9BACT|nr:hypothetical protein [Prosthecobacter fusiformis]TDU71364.1 hypothetical protein EI77_02488 [Prosthecobacter fusiformis]